jgi:hypothetical protein
MTTETKYFTPAEANRTLPLVRRIVEDILSTTKEMRLLADEIGPDAGEDEQLKKLASDVEEFMAELEEIGCYFKDWNFTTGLVDFPGMIDDSEVFLCWKSDEKSIQFYHGIEDGFAGRKLIPKEITEAE